MPFEVKHLEYNRLHLLGPRLLGATLGALSSASRHDILKENPPDFTISTGHRSVSVVRWLRRRSAGRTRSIHIGFPRVSPACFDLVITTPQYPIDDHANIVRIPIALTTAATAAPPLDNPELADLPQPRRLLIVGGPTLFWKLDRAAIVRTLDEMIEEASLDGGSVLVTSSPRTPAALHEELASIMRNSPEHTLLAEPERGPPYQSLLAAADSIRVTGDSVSMISDAIWTGKPFALVPVSMSPAGRMMFGIHDTLRPGTRAYPQDLRFFWRTLKEMGASERLANRGNPPHEIMALVVGRVRALLDARHAVLTQ